METRVALTTMTAARIYHQRVVVGQRGVGMGWSSMSEPIPWKRRSVTAGVSIRQHAIAIVRVPSAAMDVEVLENRMRSLALILMLDPGRLNLTWMPGSFAAFRSGNRKLAAAERLGPAHDDDRRSTRKNAVNAIAVAALDIEADVFAERAYQWLVAGLEPEVTRDILNAAAERAFAAEDFRRSAALDRVVRDESDVTTGAANQRRRVEALLALEAWDDVLADTQLLIERYGSVPQNLTATRKVIERALLALAGQEIVEQDLPRFAALVEAYASPTTVGGEQLVASDEVVTLVHGVGERLRSTDGAQAVPRFLFVLENFPQHERARSAAIALLDTLDSLVKATDPKLIAQYIGKAKKTGVFGEGEPGHRLQLHEVNAGAGNAPATLNKQARVALEKQPGEPGRAVLFYEAIAAFHAESDVHGEALYWAGELRATQEKPFSDSEAAIAHFDHYRTRYPAGKYVKKIPWHIGMLLYERWDPKTTPERDEARVKGLEAASKQLQDCLNLGTACHGAAPVEFHVRRARIAAFIGKDPKTPLPAWDEAIRAYKKLLNNKKLIEQANLQDSMPACLTKGLRTLEATKRNLADLRRNADVCRQYYRELAEKGRSRNKKSCRLH